MSIITTLLSKKNTREYFFLLALEAHRVRAAICQVSGNQASIKGVGESEFIEGENEAEAVDIAVSMAEKKLTPEILVDRVVFALPQSFIVKDQIKPEYLDRLKKITKDLSLNPFGYIEYPPALSFHLEKEEGAPPTLLLLHVTKQQIILSLLRVGKVQQNIVIHRTSSLTSDFETSLSQFASEILPSRIILYDEGEIEQLEELKEELLRFPWNRFSIFLHTPKIEILPQEKVMLALVEAAASSFLKTISLETTAPPTETESKTEAENKKKLEAERIEEETFGFVKTKETVTKTGEIEESVSNIRSAPIEKAEFAAADVPKKSKIKLPKLSFSLPDFSRFKFPKTIFWLVIGFAIPLIFLVALVIYYPKALVYLLVYPQSATAKVNFTFVTQENKLDSSKNIILTNPIVEEATGNKTITTTGKTKIGEKAKGEITIYNKTTNSKTFPGGTLLQTDSLKFTLDNDTSIASASETIEGLTFGKTTASVTASDIGPDGNIVSNHDFTFKDFPPTSYAAKNNKDFTGGTSREVSSVSADDQDKLETSLTGELTAKVKQQSFTKLPPGEKLINSLLTTSLVSKKFSSNIGNEAKELTLTLTIKVSSYSYKESDLTNLAQTSLPAAPVGFSLDAQRTNMIIDEAKIDKNGNITASVLTTAYFLPELDKEKIKTSILGKTYQEVSSILTSTQYVAGVKIIKETNLPFLSDRLPFSSGNINLQLTTY